MLLKGVLIGLELREFGIPALTKSRFGKKQSYEVLTPDRRYKCFHDRIVRKILTIFKFCIKV